MYALPPRKLDDQHTYCTHTHTHTYFFCVLFVCVYSRRVLVGPLSPPRQTQKNKQEEAAAKEGKAQALQEDVHLLLREKEALRQKAEALASKLVCAYMCVCVCVYVRMCALQIRHQTCSKPKPTHNPKHTPERRPR